MLRSALGERVSEVLGDEELAAPAHLDAEVLSTLFRLARTRQVDAARAELAIERFGRLTVHREALLPLLGDAFALRHRFSAADALYVVLARARAARLLTADAPLRRAAEGLVELVVP